MKKIVINRCYGGFGLSPEALLWLDKHDYKGEGFKIPVDDYFNPKHRDYERLKERALKDWRDFQKTPTRKGMWPLHIFTPDESHVYSYFGISREEPLLIKCVQVLGSKADGPHADLAIVEIPDDVDWVLSEYDGIETIEERHRSWP